MRIIALCLVCIAVTACSPAGSQSSADCPDQVRLRDVVYTWNGTTSREATRQLRADQAECDDAGEDPEGSVFPDDPVQVQTWTFEGYAPARVLGVRYGIGSFGVFIADTVGLDEQRRISADLSENQ